MSDILVVPDATDAVVAYNRPTFAPFHVHVIQNEGIELVMTDKLRPFQIAFSRETARAWNNANPSSDPMYYLLVARPGMRGRDGSLVEVIRAEDFLRLKSRMDALRLLIPESQLVYLVAPVGKKGNQETLEDIAFVLNLAHMIRYSFWKV